MAVTGRQCVTGLKAALDGSGNLVGYQLRGVGINAGNSTREDNFPSGAVDHLLIENVGICFADHHRCMAGTDHSFPGLCRTDILDEWPWLHRQRPVQFRLDLLAKAKQKPVGAIKYNIDRMVTVIKQPRKNQAGAQEGCCAGLQRVFLSPELCCAGL